MLLAGCGAGIGFGGRLTGAGDFTPSPEWQQTFFFQIGSTCTLPAVLSLITKGGIHIDVEACDSLFDSQFGDWDPEVHAGRIQVNGKFTSCDVEPVLGNSHRIVADGSYSVKLDDGASYTCDVAADRTLNYGNEFIGMSTNVSFGDRVLKGKISRATMSDSLVGGGTRTNFIGRDCLLVIGGGSPLGRASVLTAVIEPCNGDSNDSMACLGREGAEEVPNFIGGGFLSNGNLNTQSISDQTRQNMCGV
jgi:hypothetical protein